MAYQPLPHDSVAPPPSGILPNTFPDSVAVWTIDVDAGSGQRHGDAVMEAGPSPGPDPEGGVTVSQAPTWDNGNVYDPDTEIAIVTATFTGGFGDVTYRWRWQWEPYGQTNWTNGGWSSYLNTREGLIWTIPKEAQNGRVRLHCQAIDVYENAETGELETDITNSVSKNTNAFASSKSVNELPPFQVLQAGVIDSYLAPGELGRGIPAIWEGGTDESTFVARWEWLPQGLDIWQLGDFVEYPNDPLLAQVEFVVPLNMGGGKVRIFSKAQDPYVLGKNNRSNELTVDVGSVTVGDFTLEGLPYVGQTIVANQPLVVGGTGTYNILYDFGKGTQQSATYVVQQEDIGSMISCMVTAIDTNFNSDSKASTNQIGNIQAAMSLTPTTTEINGEIADVSEFIPANNNETYTIVASPYQYPNDFDISFSLRQSDGTLTTNPILAEECTFTPSPNDVASTVMVMMTSQIAGDHTYNIMFNFTRAATEIGNISVSINDIAYDTEEAPALTVLMNDPCIVILDHDGDANPTATWEARNNYPALISEQAEHVVITFPQAGMVTVTCTLEDETATDSPKSQPLNFFVVDAKTWADLKSKEES